MSCYTRDEKLKAYLEKLDAEHEHYYLVPDYKDDQESLRIAQVFGDFAVQSGGSGILTALGQRYLRDSGVKLMAHICLSLKLKVRPFY